MDEHEKAIATRQVDALVALTTAVAQLHAIVESLHGSVLHIAALAMRLEARLGDAPAE